MLKQNIIKYYSKHKLVIHLFLFINIFCLVLLFLSTNLLDQRTKDVTLYFPHYLGSFMQWDTIIWYFPIVKYGYFNILSSAFFPLYPLLLKFLTSIFLVFIHIEAAFLYSAFLLNEVFLLLTIFMLDKLLKQLGFLNEQIKNILLLFLLFPFSFFLFVPYTESLFTFFIITVFYFLQKKEYFRSALIIGIATALRPPALILVIVYILFPISDYLFSSEFKNNFISNSHYADDM